MRPTKLEATGLAASSIRRDPASRDCLECPEMVVIPSGTLVTGRPRRDVPVESFAIGVYEVTTAEWNECARSGGCGGRVLEGGEAHPVTNVSWDDAQAYVRWLSERTGREYRLPSEVEWEYAARAGTRTDRYWGDGESCWHANADWASCDDGHRYAAPVGSYAPNLFRLRDVLGNVWEWTQDCGNSRDDGGPNDGRAWEGGGL